MGKKKKEIPSYLYDDDPFCNFAMVTSNLLASKQFTELSKAARAFYLTCAVHKQTLEQSTCLFNALKEYYTLFGEEKTDYDLRLMAGQEKKAKIKSPYFVIPQSQLEQYGYTKQYATKLKKELIDKKFIKVFANEKKHSTHNTQGGNRDFSRRVTIYQFINDWKSK